MGVIYNKKRAIGFFEGLCVELKLIFRLQLKDNSALDFKHRAVNYGGTFETV